MATLRRQTTVAAILLALIGTAQAQESSTVPADLQGTWGADCSKPEMRIEERRLYQFADRASMPIAKVVRRSGEVDLHYDRVAEKLRVIDTYRQEGPTLRLVKSRYGTQEANWNKRPWQRCGGAAAQPAAQAVAQPAPQPDSTKALGLASLRFGAEAPTVATQPYLAEVAKSAADKNKLSCLSRQAYHWPIQGWDKARFDRTVQGIVDDLKAQGFGLKRLEKPVDNMLVVRVEPNQKGGSPLMLAFYIEEKKDLFLVACTTNS